MPAMLVAVPSPLLCTAAASKRPLAVVKGILDSQARRPAANGASAVPGSNMLGMQAVGSEAFRQALAPTIGAVHDLADAVAECAGRHGHQPSASSRAMEEIAVEAQFAARSDGWQEPIRDTHTFGGMTLTAAADFARSFAVLLDARLRASCRGAQRVRRGRGRGLAERSEGRRERASQARTLRAAIQRNGACPASP